MHNCAGYAFHCKKWLDVDNLPFEKVNVQSVLKNFLERNSCHINYSVHRCTNCITKDNEELIAFRIAKEKKSKWWDFHFMRRGKDGKWRHKMGKTSTEIYKGDITAPWIRPDGVVYDSKIIFLKIKKKS